MKNGKLKFHKATNQKQLMGTVEDTKKIITTTIITNIKGLVLIIVSIILGGTSLALWVLLSFHYLFTSLIIIFISFFFPVIFMKRIRSNSVEDVTIRFCADYLSLKYFDRNLFDFKTDDIKYSQINSLMVIESAKDDSSFIKLYFKDGTKSVYRFLDQQDKDTNVVPAILKFIKSYNETKNNVENIYLRKTLLASKFGYYCIVALTVMLIAAIILEIIYKPNAVPVSLGTSLFLYVTILSQRQNDLAIHKTLGQV